MAIRENRDPLEPSLSPDGDARDTAIAPVAGVSFDDEDQGDDGLIWSDSEVLSHIGQCKRMARNYQQVAAIARWEQSEAAWRSEHYAGSKYRKDQFKNRAKYFKPKSREAVLKTLAHTRAALLSSSDIISCEAGDTSDPKQRANAALLKEIIDARFTNKTRRSGVPWQQLVLGARKDAQVSGVCISKQTWEYRVKRREVRREVERPVMGANGQPVIDFMTREPLTELVEEVEEVIDVIRDRPLITLYAVEMVLLSPSAGWIDPAQDSPSLQIIEPMHGDTVRRMMEPDQKNRVPWRELDEKALQASYYSEQEVIGLKVARDANAERTGGQSMGQGANKAGAGEIVEVWENFFRVDGEDYHCYSLKNHALLSDPVPVEDVYPEQRGSRPVVIGTDTIEPHVLYPESHVYSWRESQAEINDLSNIRMDANRQATFPVAKVKAGRNIDYKAVQRRDANGLILVREQEDVVWDRPPGANPQMFEEVDRLSNDLDSLAGNFSQGSVQSNRSLNETVGGMQLIAANAGATSELFLSVFVDTWIEPVLSQVIALEQYYEDDVTLLAVSGQKANLLQKFGVSEINDELLESQITVSVNVGVGATDPMTRLLKFKTTMDLAMPYVVMAKQDGKAEIKFEDIFAEIFGQAGIKNGAERFIDMKTEEDGPPDMPAQEAQKMMQAMQAMQGELEQAKSSKEVDMAKIAVDAEKVQLDRDKLKLDAAKTAADVRGAEEERQIEQQGQVIAAGFPPGYSFEADQARVEAMLQANAQSRQDLAQIVASMAQSSVETSQMLQMLMRQMAAQTQVNADAIGQMTQALTAPKRVVRDTEGRPIGVETVQV